MYRAVLDASCLLSLAAWLGGAGSAWAQDAAPPAVTPVRPTIESNRWAEDWSVLADPALRTEPLDRLKYIPLIAGDPASYLSFGMMLRERFEASDAPSFGIGHVPPTSYLLQRLQAYTDVHLNRNWEAFVELEDDRAFGKAMSTPVDQDPLDLRLAFVAYTDTFSSNTLKARIGRQDFAFDLQRFVSSRDGPNVRQSFDAIWADWETGTWRFIGFVSQPVQYYGEQPFDDVSNRHFRFSTLRIERHVFGANELSAYYSLYERDDAKYLAESGREERQVLDARFAGHTAGLDWDLEAMGQGGTVGDKDIRAWAVGARAGYTWGAVAWQPRVGLQADAASGNSNPAGKTLGTFNPLFPNGYYFTLGGYTGYTNLIHLKPSLTVRPIDRLTVIAAVGLQWRETTADAVYVQPNVPVAGTAGHGGRWTGVYAQTRADYLFDAHLSGAIELVRYEVGEAVRHAGGHDASYAGVELKFGW